MPRAAHQIAVTGTMDLGHVFTHMRTPTHSEATAEDNSGNGYLPSTMMMVLVEMTMVHGLPTLG